MLRALYNRFLSLPLPWRRHILAGTDLSQHTSYWLFRIPGSSKPRRIALPYMPRPFARKGFANVHPSRLEGMEIPPQWVQWLKYTREDAPTLEELQADVGRRERMRVLVGGIEERWKKDGVKSIGPGTGRLDTTVEKRRQEEPPKRVVTQEDVLGTSQSQQEKEAETKSPWDQASQAQDEPAPWKPRSSPRI